MTYKLTFNKQLINHHIFPSVDAKKDKVQLGFKILKNKKMDITVNGYLLSTTNENFDKKEFESFKNEIRKDNTKVIKKELELFPYINMKNYLNINEFDKGIKSVDIETTKELMKKFRTNLDVKLSNLNIKKKVIPKNPNLLSYKCFSASSLITKKTIDSDYKNEVEESFKKKKDLLYKIPNRYFKNNLNNSLSQVLIKAKNEEEKSREEGKKIVEELRKMNYFSFSNKKTRNKIKPLINLRKKFKIVSDYNIDEKIITDITKEQTQIFSEEKKISHKNLIKKINLLKIPKDLKSRITTNY